VGLALYVWSTKLTGIPNSIVSGLASAFVTLAIVTFASEYILKTAFTEDVLEITELKHEIYNAGIMQIVEESSFSWADFIGTSGTFTAVSLRPSAWVNRVWPHVLNLAKQIPCRINISFVEPESVAARDTALRLGLDPDVYSIQINQAARDIEHEWKRAKAAASWRHESRLTVDFVDRAPSHSLARVDGKSCLLIEPIVGGAGSQSTVCFTFRDMNGQPFPDQWLAEGMNDVDMTSGTPYYTDVRQAEDSIANAPIAPLGKPEHDGAYDVSMLGSDNELEHSE